MFCTKSVNHRVSFTQEEEHLDHNPFFSKRHSIHSGSIHKIDSLETAGKESLSILDIMNDDTSSSSSAMVITDDSDQSSSTNSATGLSSSNHDMQVPHQRRRRRSYTKQDRKRRSPSSSSRRRQNHRSQDIDAIHATLAILEENTSLGLYQGSYTKEEEEEQNRLVAAFEEHEGIESNKRSKTR